MRGLGAVFEKELSDHLRDHRSLASAFLFPVLGPVLFAVMMNVLAGWADSGTAPKLALRGVDRAPNLAKFLEAQGVEVSSAPEDYEKKVQDGAFDAALILEEDFAERWREARPAGAQLVFDQSRRAASAQVARIRNALEVYGGFVASQRLFARGVNPELARALAVDEVDLATPEKLAATLLNMIPLFLVLGAFVGGMNVAIDTTAGERERGSLEPLLVNPVSRGTLMGGKWLTTVLVACLAVALTAVGFALAMKRVPLEVLGVKARIGASEIAGMVASAVPLTAFASAVQMLVATYARSFKEAQTYLSLLLLIPMVPGLVLAFVPVERSLPLYALPLLGQHLLIEDILSGEGWSMLEWALSAAGVLALATACLALCTRLLSQERIIFGR